MGPGARSGAVLVRTSLFPDPGNSLHGFSCHRLTGAARREEVAFASCPPQKKCPQPTGIRCAGLSSCLLEPGDIAALLQVPNALIVILFWEKATLAIGLWGGLVFLSV